MQEEKSSIWYFYEISTEREFPQQACHKILFHSHLIHAVFFKEIALISKGYYSVIKHYEFYVHEFKPTHQRKVGNLITVYTNFLLISHNSDAATIMFKSQRSRGQRAPLCTHAMNNIIQIHTAVIMFVPLYGNCTQYRTKQKVRHDHNVPRIVF